MPKLTDPTVSYTEATDEGTVTERDGWHKPRRFRDNPGPRFGRRRRTQPDHPRGCGCDLVTDKGAYRDETVELPGGRVIHYYHQSPVVVVDGSRYQISSCGYKTATTKERINRYLPRGYKVYQDDMEWFLKVIDLDTPLDERDPEVRPFEDGMVIET